MRLMSKTRSSPVSSSPYRGDTGVYGPSSVPDSFYRRCGHTVSSQAHRTTCIHHRDATIIPNVHLFTSEQCQLPCVHVAHWATTVGFYLMQREHSKSFGSSRSLGTLLQVLSLAGWFLELFATPEVNKREKTISQFSNHLTIKT